MDWMDRNERLLRRADEQASRRQAQRSALPCGCMADEHNPGFCKFLTLQQNLEAMMAEIALEKNWQAFNQDHAR